jgi:hypothetical protein
MKPIVGEYKVVAATGAPQVRLSSDVHALGDLPSFDTKSTDITPLVRV